MVAPKTICGLVFLVVSATGFATLTRTPDIISPGIKRNESVKDVADWSKCISSVPDDNFVTPEYIFPLDNGHQTRIVHTASTRTIHDYAYEFAKLTKIGFGGKRILSTLKNYFSLISTNLCLLSLMNMWIGRLKITYQVAFASTCLNFVCPR